MKNTKWLGWMLLTCLGFSMQQDAGTGTLEISIIPQFAGQTLVTSDHLYGNSNGDSLYIDVLRFYISSVTLQGKDISFQEKDSYHLVDAADSNSQKIVLKNIPAGRYESLVLYIGTDSLTNVSGAMGGDLDPTLGMYWAWNTGYINFKIEGRSPSCQTLHHEFTFHIGGYMPPHQTIRRVEWPLKDIIIKENGFSRVQVIADVAGFLNHIQLETTNQVMIPSRQAAELADYFTDIFKCSTR